MVFVEDSSSRFFLILSFTQTSPLSQGLLWIRLVPSGHYIDRVLVLGVEDLDRLPLVDTIWSVVCLDRLFAPFSLPLPRFPYRVIEHVMGEGNVFTLGIPFRKWNVDLNDWKN